MNVATVSHIVSTFTNCASMNVAAVGGIAGLRRVEGLRWTVTALPRGAKGAFIGGGGSGWFLLNGAGRIDETWELLKTVESALRG